MSVASSIAGRIKRRILSPPPKTWARSQEYELQHAYAYMNIDWFKAEIAAFSKGRHDAATGYVDPMAFREFFNGDPSLWDSFKSSVTGKIGVDVGMCLWSPMASWSFLSRRIAIEPLGEKTRDYQLKHFGRSFFDTMELRPFGADVFLPDLEGAIDGVIYCRNMLDHTPNWPFVIANLGLYAAPGCYLLFWSDYNHDGTANEGHYDLCDSADDIRRVVRSLGFKITREFEDSPREERNWGCVAIKM
jgi:hypothetical protein